jgi:hypothetical protein
MNRPFPRFEVLGLTAALAFVGACTPNTSVKPGAPVIIELSVVENGGATITTVTPTTPSCPGATPEGGACDSVMYAVCEATTNNLCRCVPNPPPPPPPPPVDASASDAATSDAAAAMSDAGQSDAGKADAGAATSDAGSDAAPAMLTGTWSCTFAPTSTVLYVFDRILDTEFLGDGGGAFGLASISSDPTPPTAVMLNGDYASNGSPNIILNSPAVGDYRADGPSILFAAIPALPTSATVSVTLDNTKVLAKDGRTPFTGMNLLKDGMISFITQPFTASPITPPAPIPPAADAGTDAAVLNAPDMTPATITFTNTVDPTALAAHVTVTTALSVPVPVDVTSMDGLTVTIAPKAGTNWPASSTITIAIDATATDAVGDLLAAPVAPVSFMTTSAM